METQRSRLIVADAGPLLVLSRIGELGLLPGIFGDVSITHVVRDELIHGGNFPGQDDIASALADWLRVREVDCGSWLPMNPDLDPGETSSIFLAEQVPGSLLIIDDKAGRQEAATRGLAFVGLVGVLREAKIRNLIPAIGPMLTALCASGYYLSDSLMCKVLAAVDE